MSDNDSGAGAGALDADAANFPRMTRQQRAETYERSKYTYNVQITVAAGVLDSADGAVAAATPYANRPSQGMLRDLKRHLPHPQ